MTNRLSNNLRRLLVHVTRTRYMYQYMHVICVHVYVGNPRHASVKEVRPKDALEYSSYSYLCNESA